MLRMEFTPFGALPASSMLPCAAATARLSGGNGAGGCCGGCVLLPWHQSGLWRPDRRVSACPCDIRGDGSCRTPQASEEPDVWSLTGMYTCRLIPTYSTAESWAALAGQFQLDTPVRVRVHRVGLLEMHPTCICLLCKFPVALKTRPERHGMQSLVCRRADTDRGFFIMCRFSRARDAGSPSSWNC